MTPGRLAIGAALLALFSGTIGGVLGVWWASPEKTWWVSRQAAPAASASATAGGCDVTSVAARVFPSLVTVNVTAAGGRPGGVGSGSVLDGHGHILTNDHVIAAAAGGGAITVDFARGSRVRGPPSSGGTRRPTSRCSGYSRARPR